MMYSNQVFEMSRRGLGENLESETNAKHQSVNFCCLLLYSMFYILGSDIYFQSKKFLKSKITCLCQGIAFCTYLYLIATHMLPLLSNQIEIGELKFLASHFVLHCIALLLWLFVAARRMKLSKALKDVQKLKRSLKTQYSNTFTNLCVVLSILSYILLLSLFFYPYTEEEHQTMISDIDIFNVFPSDGSATFLLYLLGSFFQAYFMLYPICFIALYVILCHDMQTILTVYVRQKTSEKPAVKKCSMNRFNYYITALTIFKDIESILSLPIFVAYVSYIISLITSFLYAKYHERHPMNDCIMVFSYSMITAVSLAASGVHEADKIAKEVNLKSLEILLKRGQQIEFGELVKIWRSNNSPAFCLSGWGFFKFTKGNYLNAIGYLVTYTLLIMNI